MLVEVSGGDTQEDVNAYLATVADHIPRDVDLIVDVTRGFRHFSFLTYIAVFYLTALRGVRVRGAYYGLLQENEPISFLDLRPLLDLPHWVHALDVLHDTGSTLPMAQALGDAAENPSVEGIARDLSRLSKAELLNASLRLRENTPRASDH